MSFQIHSVFINKTYQMQLAFHLNISGLKPHIFIETKLLSSSATHLCTSLGYIGLPLIRSTPVRSVTEIKISVFIHFTNSPGYSTALR